MGCVNKSTLGILSGLGAASIWGGMYVVSKVVLEVVPPFTLVSLRLILGILTLAIVVVKQGGEQLTPRQYLSTILVGLLGYGISLSFQFIGTRLSTASNGALVTSATPAFVLLFAAWLLREPITRLRLLALIIATLGVVLVIDPRNARLTSDLFLGNLSLVAAALTWALYSVLVRKTTQQLPLIQATLVFFMGGLFITIPAAITELQAAQVGPITLLVFFGILYLGVVSTAGAMVLWNFAFAALDAGVASLTFFAQPVVGAILGTLLLGEKLSTYFLLGGALIGAGIVLATDLLSKHKSAHKGLDL